jgi:hypothetical protein
MRSYLDHPRSSWGAVAALACAASPGAVLADVLYDQRSFAINGTWNENAMSHIGGNGYWGFLADVQSADDFVLAGASTVTRVTVDFGTVFTAHPDAAPSGGFLVEIFANDNGRPAAAPSFSASVSTWTRLGTFAEGQSPDYNFSPDHRHVLAFDLPGGGASLDAGTWWLAVQAVDTTPFGDYHFIATRMYATGGTPIGASAQYRDASVAHGNPYEVPFISESWLSLHGAQPSDLSFSVEGVGVPGPGSLAVVAVAGAAAMTRRRVRSSR